LALERAYEGAAISMRRIGLVEAHGTGTVVGDLAELAGMTALFTDAGVAPGSCALGSVKSQIGHTKCVAGLAGLTKVAMSLHTGVLHPPRTLNNHIACGKPTPVRSSSIRRRGRGQRRRPSAWRE
jgi:acyl transferase domain-containing protein